MMLLADYNREETPFPDFNRKYVFLFFMISESLISGLEAVIPLTCGVDVITTEKQCVDVGDVVHGFFIELSALSVADEEETNDDPKRALKIIAVSAFLAALGTCGAMKEKEAPL